MLNVAIYFLPAMVFIASIVFCLWLFDSRNAKARRIENDYDESDITEPVTLHPSIKEDLCTGCAICADACLNGVIAMRDNKAFVSNPKLCLGHGTCYRMCPENAITLRIGTEKRGEDIPHVLQNFESSTPGIFIAGELGGMGMIKNACEQAIEAVENIARTLRLNRHGDYDLVIVGAGPAGIAAGLTAKMHNLRFILVEQDTIGRSVANYPRRRIRANVVLDLPLAGEITLNNTSKKQLSELWRSMILRYRIPLQENCMISSIVNKDGGFYLMSSSKQQFSTQFVLLTIGRRGSPVKLNIPGEEMEKVAYRLSDPESISGQKILIAGCGNSTIESALLLADKNHVTVVCPEDNPGRLSPLSRKSFGKAVSRGKIDILFKTLLVRIEEKYVTLSSEKGNKRLANDLVYIFSGSQSTSLLIEKPGVEITSFCAEEALIIH